MVQMRRAKRNWACRKWAGDRRVAVVGDAVANRDTQAAWEYHDGTKHPNGGFLDWWYEFDPSLRPWPFKEYRDLPPRDLPLDTHELGVPALEAICVHDGATGTAHAVDLPALTRLFYYAAGITKWLTRGPGEKIPFRAAACTGALYHIEIYLVCGEIEGLAAGVYHLDPQGPAIRQLRAGDYRSVLVEASGQEPAVAHAPAVFIASDVTWRNAVKYQAREYRHAFWDSGTMLANLLAMSVAHELPAKVVAGFVDAQVGRLLGLDPMRELPLALVPVGAAMGATIPPSPPLATLNLAAGVDSEWEIDFPVIRTMHAASSLADPASVTVWRGALRRAEAPAVGPLIALQPLPKEECPADTLETVVMRRGSTRRFRRAPLTFAQLSTLLHRSLQGVPADFHEVPGAVLFDVYLTIHAVDGLAPGAYVLRREQWALELLEEGDFRDISGYLGLEQDLAADASADLFFLAELPPILARFGNRGYRAAQLDASIAAGRAYLAAYAQRFGATGLTFYDDEVVRFFSPHAQGKSVLFLIALGYKA